MRIGLDLTLKSALKTGPSDVTAPTIEITSASASPVTTNPIAVTFMASEAVIGFAVGDITIGGGGSLASFATSDNIIFTASWTLGSGTNTLDIAGGVCVDGVGNSNAAATQFARALIWYLAGGVLSANVVGAYRAIGAASLAASKVNIANPGTNDLTEVTAVTWNAVTGWTAGVLNTGIVPASGYSALARYSGFTGFDRRVFGAKGATGNSELSIDPYYMKFASGGEKEGSSQLQTGVVGIAGQNGFREGAKVVTAIPAWNAASVALYIRARNNNGTIDQFFNAPSQAFAIYNSTLIDAQMLAITDAMNALTNP